MEIVELNNGLKVVNAASGHPYNMEDGTVVPPSGYSLNAKRAETTVEHSDIPDGVDAVKTEMDKPSKLLESVMERMITSIKGISSNITAVDVSIKKLSPPIGGNVDSVELRKKV